MVIKGLELCSVGTSLGDTEDLRRDRLFFCTDHISHTFPGKLWQPNGLKKSNSFAYVPESKSQNDN